MSPFFGELSFKGKKAFFLQFKNKINEGLLYTMCFLLPFSSTRCCHKISWIMSVLTRQIEKKIGIDLHNFLDINIAFQMLQNLGNNLVFFIDVKACCHGFNGIILTLSLWKYSKSFSQLCYIILALFNIDFGLFPSTGFPLVIMTSCWRWWRKWSLPVNLAQKRELQRHVRRRGRRRQIDVIAIGASPTGRSKADHPLETVRLGCQGNASFGIGRCGAFSSHCHWIVVITCQ